MLPGMTGLVADPSWRAEVREEGLLVHGGADAVYLLPDLAAPVAAELVALFNPESSTVDVERLSPDARLLLPQLRGVGALRVAGLAGPTARVAVRQVAGGADAVLAELHRQRACELVEQERADLEIVVRTDAPLRDLLPLAHEYAEARRPHLLCDLATRHTVVLGPLVVPGLTACLSCLVGRLASRWGDPTPPERPAALDEPALVAALLGRVLRTMTTGRYELVERTVALNLDDLSTSTEAVLPAGECPVCPRVDPIGVRLPWEEH
jgi:hypothetical protein